MIMCRRPAIVPTPQTTPAAGAPPHSVYISHAGPQADFKKPSVRVDQLLDPLASRKASFFVLPLDGFAAAAQDDFGLLFTDPGGEVGQVGCV